MLVTESRGPSDDVAALTEQLRSIVGVAHRLTSDIEATLADLHEFTQTRIERRGHAGDASYEGVERRRDQREP